MYIRANNSSGGGGGSAPELIWENPNPTSATGFIGQTIDENATGWKSGKTLADYDGFIIAAVDYYTMSSRKRTTSYLIKDVTGMSVVGALYSPVLPYVDSSAVPSRSLSYNNGIVIGNCSGGHVYIVPLYIWGVKGTLTET